MSSCMFDTCCGCIDLRTGCLIIGYLNLVADIVFIIVSIIGLSAAGAVANSNDSDLQAVGAAFIAISVILLVVILFFFTFTVVLLVGVHNNKRGHVKAYLIVSVICLAVSIITTLCSFGGYYEAWEITSRIIGYILSIYFLLVIRSYYYKMEDKAPTYNNA